MEVEDEEGNVKFSVEKVKDSMAYLAGVWALADMFNVQGMKNQIINNFRD